MPHKIQDSNLRYNLNKITEKELAGKMIIYVTRTESDSLPSCTSEAFSNRVRERQFRRPTRYVQYLFHNRMEILCKLINLFNKSRTIQISVDYESQSINISLYCLYRSR